MLKKFFSPSSGNTPEPLPNRAHALRCIPLKNPECETSRQQEGLLLRYPVRVHTLLDRILPGSSDRKPAVSWRKLQLDAMGSQVWEMIDNRKNVQDISRAFAAHHQLNEREAEISVSEFIQQLGRRGLIALREPAA